MQSSWHDVISVTRRIMIMDDEPDILEFLQILLQEEGFEVTIVSNKGDFLELLQDSYWPDLFLLDVFLSGSDGREIAAFLKGKEETQHIPILMFSAHPDVSQTACQAGADDFLAKSFDIDVLLDTVARLLSPRSPEPTQP
jgi:DNA-binding response OmpR family regulator